MVADSDLPPLDAVITADPSLTPVTTPLEETVAMEDDELHVIELVEIVMEFASRTVAEACVVPPNWIVEALSETVTLATIGHGAVMARSP